MYELYWNSFIGINSSLGIQISILKFANFLRNANISCSLHNSIVIRFAPMIDNKQTKLLKVFKTRQYIDKKETILTIQFKTLDHFVFQHQ